MEKRIVRQVDYLQELNRDARSAKHKIPRDLSLSFNIKSY